MGTWLISWLWRMKRERSESERRECKGVGIELNKQQRVIYGGIHNKQSPRGNPFCFKSVATNLFFFLYVFAILFIIVDLSNKCDAFRGDKTDRDPSVGPVIPSKNSG